VLDISSFVFLVASLVLIVTPGQDMVLVMSRSIAQGAAAGRATAAGVSVGLVGHTLVATVGLGAILRASEWLFIALKLAGAAHLFYLGVGLLRTKGTQLDVQASSRRSLRRLFLDGALSNVSNPKIAVFHFAFLPHLGRKALWLVACTAECPRLALSVERLCSRSPRAAACL